MARLQQPHRNGKQHLPKKSKNSHKKTHKKEASSKRRGPRLPFSLRKELHLENHRRAHGDGEGNAEEEEDDSQLPTPSDVYEYEENQAPKESHQNRRFDDVGRLGYEMPSDIEDEEIDEDAADGEAPGSRQDEDVIEAEDGSDTDINDGEGGDERHQKMIEAVLMPRKKKPKEKSPKRIELLSEAYPESEFNINPVADANNLQQITVEDLMAPLQSTTGFGSLRKRMQQVEKKGVAVDAPLPKGVQERLSRKAGYEKTNEEISKWQDIVKKNREAASLVFTQRPDLLTDTSTAELVSKFEPVTNVEKEVASLLQANGLADDTTEAANTLGFNKLTMDEVKERQERLAKMRSMLSYHEAKSKRTKKIKSKTYHRLLQKDRKGKAGQEGEPDPESLKEAAVKAEFKRAQERMTLKHKNTSKWAKRIIKRGLKAKEDGSREALAEQLRTHSALTRKIQSTDNAGPSDDSSDEMGTDSGSNDENSGPSLPMKAKSKLLAKAKVETLKVLEGDAEAEIPMTGLFSLPFMTRAIEKKRKQAQSEAIAVLEQLEQLEYSNGTGGLDFEVDREAVTKASPGRLVFGDMARSISNEEPDMLVEDGSSSDEDVHEEDRGVPAVGKTPLTLKKRKVESSEKAFNGLENASQTELIQRAFAGDDVEADFEQVKSEALNEEVPLGEAALNLPGWGQWIDVQMKRGPPLWMVKHQEELQRKREQALNKRKDSKLKHVIISERMDKKAEKFVAPTLPFPFKSRNVFERSNRMPIGREFNSDQAFRDMIRPSVVKDAGVIIAPIKYKMSEAKAGDSISISEGKKGSRKRVNGFIAGLKRKSDTRSNGFVYEDKQKDNKRVYAFQAKRKTKCSCCMRTPAGGRAL